MSARDSVENGERRAALISGAVVVAIVVAGALFDVMSAPTCLLCSKATTGERLCDWCRALIRGEEIEARHEEWWA